MLRPKLTSSRSLGLSKTKPRPLVATANGQLSTFPIADDVTV